MEISEFESVIKMIRKHETQIINFFQNKICIFAKIFRGIIIMAYFKGISDNELQHKLNASGAVLTLGAKTCGKTESAKQLTKSILEVNIDLQASILVETTPICEQNN